VNMQLGMIGLGRMGAEHGAEAPQGGHDCVVFDMSRRPWKSLFRKGGRSRRPEGFVKSWKSRAPVWLIGPAAVVDKAIPTSYPTSRPGYSHRRRQSYYIDDIRRAKELAAREFTTWMSAQAAACGVGTRLLHDDRRRSRGG